MASLGKARTVGPDAKQHTFLQTCYKKLLWLGLNWQAEAHSLQKLATHLNCQAKRSQFSQAPSAFQHQRNKLAKE